MMKKIIILGLLVVTVCTGCGKKDAGYAEHIPTNQLTEEERTAYVTMYGVEEITLEDGTVVTIDDLILLGKQQERARIYRSTPEGKILYAADYDSFTDYLNEAFDEESRNTFFENEEKYSLWYQAWLDAYAEQQEKIEHDHSKELKEP